jgi:hypothetical protein
MEITAQIDRLRVHECSDLQSIVGLKNIVSLYDEDSKEIYDEDPIGLGEKDDQKEDESEEEDDDSDDDGDDGDDNEISEDEDVVNGDNDNEQ